MMWNRGQTVAQEQNELGFAEYSGLLNLFKHLNLTTRRSRYVSLMHF